MAYKSDTAAGRGSNRTERPDLSDAARGWPRRGWRSPASSQVSLEAYGRDDEVTRWAIAAGWRLVSSGTIDEHIVDLHLRERDPAEACLKAGDAPARPGATVAAEARCLTCRRHRTMSAIRTSLGP